MSAITRPVGQLTELDLALVDAVQVNPRATWATIAPHIGVSPVTAARRWQNLASAGLVWSGSVMGPALFSGAVLEFASEPRSSRALVEQLVAHPDVFTVGRTTGEFDVYALTVAPSSRALVRSVVDHAGVSGVSRVRTNVYVRVFGGQQWRLSVLNSEDAAGVRGDPLRAVRAPELDDVDRRMFMFLSADARVPFPRLADGLGVSAQLARRRFDRMMRSGHMALRADVARPLAGWPTAAIVWMSVPAHQLDAVGKALGAWREARFCAAVAATSNLVLVLNLRAAEDLLAVENRLLDVAPEATLVEQRLVVRMEKVNGHVLDELGRSSRVVPVDPWLGDASDGPRTMV